MSVTWADMFDLAEPGTAGADWSADDLRAMWRHQLAAPIPGEGVSVGEALHAARPAARLLDRVGRSGHFDDAAQSLPPVISAALAMLCRAARARVNADSDGVSQAEGEAIRADQVDATLAQAWLDPTSRELLTGFRATLPESVAPDEGRGSRAEAGGSKPLGDEDPADAARRGRYQIERPHAEGGLGVLSVARDVDLDRAVALKEIRPELRADADSRRRFVREAQIAGALEHPNIVPVYALGRDAAGNPYYAMRFVGGRTLEQAITQHHRQPTLAGLRDLLRRFGDVCRAMAYAHSRGIVHRDLKPLNIMLGDFGETWIIDWGIAKRVTETEPAEGESTSAFAGTTFTGTTFTGTTFAPLSSSPHTLVGQSLGTPRYMSPEQRADASRAGPPSDVFSLGAILGQIVTGHPPRPDRQTGALAPAPAHPRARTGRRRLGRDVRALEAIAARATSPEPSTRYPDAGELAAEVERWLADEPVRAYDEPLLNTLSRWTRRHRAAVVAGVLLLLTSAVVLGVANVRVRGERDDRDRAFRDASASAEAARQSERVAQERLATSLILTADGLMNQGRAVEAGDRYREALAVVRSLGMPETGTLCGLLDAYVHSPRPLAAWPYPALPVATPVHPDPDVLLTGDGRTAILGDRDGSLVWLEFATGVERARRPGHPGGVRAMAVTDDGRTLVTGGHDGAIAIWDAAARRELRRVERAHAAPVRQLALSRDGSTLLSAGDDGRVKVWDVGTGRERGAHTSRSMPEHVDGLGFTPDGTGGISACHGGAVVVWDLATGAVRQTFNTGWACAGFPHFLGGDDDLLVRGGNGELGVWSYASAAPRQTLSTPDRLYRAIALNRAAGVVLGVSYDGMLSIWDLAGQQRQSQPGLPKGVLSVGISDDGGVAMTAGQADGTVSLWPTGPTADLGVLRGHDWRVLTASFSGDGRLVASAGWDGTVRVWDVATGREVRRFGDGGGEAGLDYWSVAFGADGDTLYAGDSRGTLTAWSLAGGATRFAVAAHVKPAAAATLPATLPTTVPTTAPAPADHVTDIALSPDGRTLATCGADGTVKLWDPATGAPLRTVTSGQQKARSLAFTRDGRLLLCAGYDRLVRFWDTATWQQQPEPLSGHLQWVNAVDVSPDGRFAVTASFDGEMKLWDLATRRPIRSVVAHGVSTSGVAFSPDGHTIASCGEDSMVRVWDRASGTELHRFAHHRAGVRSVAFSPDGTKLLSASFDQTLIVHDLSRPESYARFAAEVPAAHRALASNPNDGAALAKVGHWFGFRGQDAVAADLLERAAAGGAAEVSPLALARHYWRLGQTAKAGEQFRRAAERGEAPAAYLALCADAAGR